MEKTMALVAAALLLAACQEEDPAAGATESPAEVVALPERPREGASAAFWESWGDSKAEVSGYSIRTPRYGEVREGEEVLVYVVEPMDRSTWIKDDSLPEAERTYVMKLVRRLEFQTGIYPYSVETCVYAPVDRYRAERFAPVKVTLSVQEWCGHVYHALWPGPERALEDLHSYFESEGEARRVVEVPSGALYEDALWIQLRELDGPFAGGGDWEGWLVPTLWSARRAHRPLAPVRATIRHTEVDVGEARVTAFTLEYGDVRRTFHVERDPPRRILAWTGPRGEEARILKTARLAYWELNAPGDEARRSDLGLPVEEGR